MASRFIEDSHISRINKVLARRGLECIRSPCVSIESGSAMGVVEEQVVQEEEEEALPQDLPQEELDVELWEESFEEEKEIFPTPSLRHLLSDKVRKIEEQNRLHVLPKEFRTDIDPAAIPKIAITPQQKYIDIIAEMLGCKKYKSSLPEFWFLDTMANLLRRAQEDLLCRPTQAVLMLWFCEWMKEIQSFDAADRPRMMKRFKDNMFSAARFIAVESRLPTPEEAGVRYKALEDAELTEKSSPAMMESKAIKGLVTFEGTAFECAMGDMMKIMHYIFDLIEGLPVPRYALVDKMPTSRFSTDYQFDLVRSIFTFTPDYELIVAPYQLQTPKRIYAPLKVKPKKEKPQKKDQGKVKGKKKDVDTAEYLALMEFKAKEERELDEQEERDREDWNRRSHILPLGFAATDELFDKYWPPPPPEPPPPEPEPNKAKKKGGKKSP